jgi:hypothetical protein
MGRVFFAAVIVGGLVLSSICLGYSGGSGTAEEPYGIATKADLLELAGTTTDYNKCFILTADINMGGQVFTTAIIAKDTSPSSGFQGTAFTGTFDGNSHKIANFTINGGSNDYLGLFGDINNTEVKNLGLEKISIAAGNNSDWLGALAGYNDHGSISNCYSTVIITGGNESRYLGGLIGQNFLGNITNCFSTGYVAAKPDSEAVGGLVGYNYGDISHSFFKGDVNGSTSSIYIGGLAGRSDFAHITDCNTSGSVIAGESTWRVGGLIGYNTGMDNTITDCFSTADVTAIDSWFLGGLIGHCTSGKVSGCSVSGSVTNSNSLWFLGGLVGNMEYGDINDCRATCEINSGRSSKYLGGLAGYSGDLITNSFATGNITAGDYSQYIGGLVGESHDIATSFANGSITSGYSYVSYIGGLVGMSHSDVINCYAGGNIRNGITVGGLVGYNAAGGRAINCYAVSSITNCAFFGGLIGDSYFGGAEENSYFLKRNGYDNGYGTPLTETQMKQQSSFVGWDFVGEVINGTNDIWKICDGMNYPKLSWQIPLAGDFVCPDGVEMHDLAVLCEEWLCEELSADVWPEGGDGIVNFFDWAVFASQWQIAVDYQTIAEFAGQWLRTGARYYIADIAPAGGGDGMVNMLDFAVFANNWMEGN